jgi:signal transduction histidine kinase
MAANPQVSSVPATPTLQAHQPNNSNYGVTLWQSLGIAVLVAVGYYVGTIVGFWLTPSSQPISTFWPPNAILLAALLLVPRRTWWIILLAVLLAHLIAQLRSGVPLPTAMGWFIGNTGEAVVGAVCISHFTNQRRVFESVRGVLLFLIFGVVFAPLVMSFLDAAVVVWTGWGNGYWVLWTARLFSNMLAASTIVPAIVLFSLHGLTWIRTTTVQRWIEFGLLAAALTLVTVFVFGSHHASSNTIPALMYAPLPLLLWASVRFGSGGLSVSLLLIAVVSIWGAIHGRGPFTSASMSSNVLSLQGLLSTIAFSLLLLSSLLVEQEMAQAVLTQTSAKLIDAQERERHRIALELHDEVGQQLSLVEFEVASLRAEVVSSSFRSRLERLADLVSEASRTVREISHSLFPAKLQYLGLAKALRGLCRDISQETSLSIAFEFENPPETLPAPIVLCLYRVVQEALHNTAKHGHARNAKVELKVNFGQLQLSIVDDGKGFKAEEHGYEGLGLASMCERLRAVDGSMNVVSRPGVGTTIIVSVPVPPLQGAQTPHVA